MASLLLPVAGIIAAEEEHRLPAGELADLKKKEALTRTARTLMDYTRATALNHIMRMRSVRQAQTTIKKNRR
ncbi:hypothetical protein ACFF2W_004427 [Enterobacter kobei]